MVTDSTSQADETTAFLRAARSGNLEKVIEFLDTDLDINTANTNGLNALHLASKDGHVEIVTELLRRGAKVDAATKKGNTALHIASLAGQVDIVNILIQYGAAVNIQSQNGFTPLYMAAQENHDQVVKLLLNNGANQSLATEDGFTPLAVAMQQGHDKVVSVLLENDSKGKVRLPALHIAAKKDDCKAADLLLQNDHKPDVTSKSGFTPLHIAAHYGNEEIARLLIKRGADVNYLAKHNISPLHVAAKWGKNNMVKVLLENSAQIDAKTRDGLTPLHCAARSGHEQVITTLLEHSAPISARTKNGLAPLHMASQGDHVDAARVLLYHRAPVDEVTIDYLTSLHVAAHCGHVRVAKLLLDRKADPNARALNGFTPLHIACKKNRIKVVELLLKHGASIESTTESGLTPLHVASFMGCMNIVIFLLQHEANPDVPTVRGETPLHLAARANQTDIIRILLRNGAKVDARAREQQTPLHIASRLGNIDIVMLLLQHGAAVDTTTKDMYTALHIAAKEGQEEVAAILVENNASLKATTKNGFTPLHIAAKYGNMSVAKILLQKDSKLDAQGKNDISSLHLACHYDHPNVANLLLEEGASPHLASQNGHTPLHIAARKNQMDIASTLLENGANANTESKAGFTPLHFSAQKGHYDMTNLLIEHGADPNHKSKNGLTAMHLCAQEDFIKVASILVKNGADVESQTETGYRPVHVAAHFGNLSVIRFLLKHNANINVVTNQNYSPLHQAAQQGHANIVSALLEANASHKARTSDGLTALNIAQKLGYISVMEVLKGLSYDGLAPDNKSWDEKYKVIAPESLQETSFMSDSDEEGGSDALISEQPYRYLTADLMKSLRDDSLPIDVTRDDPVHRPVTKEEKQEFTQSNNYCLAESFDNDGFNLGFLISFLVDARGGALKGCRHSGVRIIIPPRRATMPIRVTCRLVKSNKVTNPPPLMEGEALATRIIEMGPIGATFLGPVLIDIPHFASIRGKEREIIILRSENGETWKEHDNYVDNDTSLLNTSYDVQMNAAYSGRITRIITTDFPQYFAIITRIKQEVHVIGAEGGILTSSVADDVQAVFPPGALTKKIKVGLQAHVIPAELTAKLLGNCVAVSPVITIEPRRRKFHKPITLTIPVPQAANKGMINQYGGETPTLRLLCSITGGTSESQWEDVTGSTPLTFVNGTVSFTTTVSARFWLMDCRNIGAIPKMATALYEESLFVPYITNFVIYSKQMDVLEATLKILCMTDGKEGMHTLERQEEFVEIVKSRDVETLDGKDLYIEFSGNLVPVTKSGVQLKFTFKAFRQNRLSFHVKVKDPLLDPVARMLFMREPKVAKGELPQQPICVLNIVLPKITTKIEAQRILKDYQDSNIISQKLVSYEPMYKMEQREKRDESKDTTPCEKKFITDTLQKERTDAAIIQESLVQKAACSLEYVDASYPSKIVGPELSPSVERQTYSEKRKFWEDISKKRESYQRSESEVSGTSQLTINESDSEYVQHILTTDTAEIAQQIEKSETMEDLNVPDISECSVAEKAQYFEEQIQKETTKLAVKLVQQDPVKGTKTKAGGDREDMEKDGRYMIEIKDVTRVGDVKGTKRLSVEEEEEQGESNTVCVELADTCTTNLSNIELSKVRNNYIVLEEIATEGSVNVERPTKDDDTKSYDLVASVELVEAVEDIRAKPLEEQRKVEECAEETMESSTFTMVHSSDTILVQEVGEIEVNAAKIPEDRPTLDGLQAERVQEGADKVTITTRMQSADVEVEEVDAQKEKLEYIVRKREGVKEPLFTCTVDRVGREVEKSAVEFISETIAADKGITQEEKTIEQGVTSETSTLIGELTERREGSKVKKSTAELTMKREEIVKTNSELGQTEVEGVAGEKVGEHASTISAQEGSTQGGGLQGNIEISAQAESTKKCIDESWQFETVLEASVKPESVDERIAGEIRESVQDIIAQQRIMEGVREITVNVLKHREEESGTAMKCAREAEGNASDTVKKTRIQRETIKHDSREEAREAVIRTQETVADESRCPRRDVVCLSVQERSETVQAEKDDVVREKPCGRCIITEETTIIYKVQKGSTLVQEQVLKSVQMESGGDALGALAQVPDTVNMPEGSHEARMIGDVKSEAVFAANIEREMQKFVERERGVVDVRDEIRRETMSVGQEKLEKSASVSESVVQRETEIGEVRKEEIIEFEPRFVKKDFESRIPVAMAKLDKDKIHKEESKVKTSVETKLACKQEIKKELHAEAEDISPTGKKKEFESRIPKRVIEAKSDKHGKKDRREGEQYPLSEKKSCEEVSSNLGKHCFAKSETRTFETFEMFDDRKATRSEFATVTSTDNHKMSSIVEKEGTVSSEVCSGRDAVITPVKRERVEKEKLAESPVEILAVEEIECEELDNGVTASKSRPETKMEETLKKLHGVAETVVRMTDSNVSGEGDASMSIRVKGGVFDGKGWVTDGVETVGGKTVTGDMFKSMTGLDDIGMFTQGESYKDTKESFDVVKVMPIVKKQEEACPLGGDEEPVAPIEGLEERQWQKFKEIEARTIAETLIQSIESEIGAKTAAELISKNYLKLIISENVGTDHEKLAADLTRQFESIMRRSAVAVHDSIVSPRQMLSMQEDTHERELTSVSVREDVTKEEELFQHEREESFPLSLSSSSQAKLQDRDITMSPSSISEQMDFEETIDVDTNELEGTSSKPTFSPPFQKQRSDKSCSLVEVRDFTSDTSLPQGKIVFEISGAGVLEILEPDSHSREDSVDVPSLEMDEHKFSEQTSRGIPSLQESVGIEPFERFVQERDITISPSTVSEDTNVDYSMMLEPSDPIAMQRDHEIFSAAKRTDSFEIGSLDLISAKPKVRGLEIKPVDWMIGDEKIEISETLQPSQIFNQELEVYESMQKKGRPSTLSTVTDVDHDRPLAGKRTKFIVIPVNEQDLESELVENKLDISSQECGSLECMVDTLECVIRAKTPVEEYVVESSRSEKPDEEDVLQADRRHSEQRDFAVTTVTDGENIVTEVTRTQDRTKREIVEGVSSSKTEDRKEMMGKVELENAVPRSDAEFKLEKVTELTKELDKSVKESALEEMSDVDKTARMDDVLKGWTETYLSKMKSLSEDYRRHMEKATDKHDKPGISATVPSDICAFKRKKEEPLPNVDLSARYAITVLDQVVKKEIAEVKESLEAAKQDLIEELSENSETVIQIKDSPSEFQFKLQLESIPNDLPFLYTSPPVLEETRESVSVKMADSDASLGKSAVPYEEEEDIVGDKAETKIKEPASIRTEESAILTRDREEEITPLIKAEGFDEETAAITVHEDSKDAEDEHPSPLPASMSGSDVDNKDESSSLVLPPRPVLKRRQKAGRSSKRVTSESDADLGSSSGESSNYQSCDYEIGSGSRPSSSDMEAMQSCGVLSATTSEYETAVMSVEHSSASKPTSQDYYTAVTTMSSRESMKSLASLSSGHLGSIDSTSELSETLVPSEPDADNEEVDEKLNSALDDEQTERTDSSGSDMFPIDESIDKIGSHIPCRMKRSSEMIFPQVLEDTGLDINTNQDAVGKGDKGVDFSTSTSTATTAGIIRSVDIMTSRVAVDGVRSVCTQVISTQVDRTEDVIVGVSVVKPENEFVDMGPMNQQKIDESMSLDAQAIESVTSEQKSVPGTVSTNSLEMSAQTSTQSLIQQASMSTSSTSGVSIDTVIEKEKPPDRHSPDSDSFEMIDKPDIIDDFVVIEEVGREAVEYDSEGKGIRISAIAQLSSKQYDRDLENLISETKGESQALACQTSKNAELFDFESEESPPQVSSGDQYSQSYLDDEQYGGGKKWLEMQFHADTRVYDVEYDRGPLEDIKEEEITDFEPGSSRFGSLGSHKGSIGSVGSMRGSFGSTPDYDILAGKKYLPRPSDHDNVSLSSLQEFENLESAVAAENSRKLHCGSHDSVNNGSLPRRYMSSRSGHGDDVSLSSLKDFEGLEKACREAHLIELRAREEEDLLEHESPENKYKLESLPRTRVDATSTAGSFNASTDVSGSDDYEKRIKEIDEIIRIAQSNVEKFDRQDDTTEDISQIDITDAEKTAVVPGVAMLSIRKQEESEPLPPVQRESDVMETSTDSLELEDNIDKQHHPLCRSSDSLEMKTTLDFPSLSSDSLNNVRDAKEVQSDVVGHASGIRRISSDSLDMPLLEQQDADGQEIQSHGGDHQTNCMVSESILEFGPQRRTGTDVKDDKAWTMPNAGT